MLKTNVFDNFLPKYLVTSNLYNTFAIVNRNKQLNPGATVDNSAFKQ